MNFENTLKFYSILYDIKSKNVENFLTCHIIMEIECPIKEHKIKITQI